MQPYDDPFFHLRQVVAPSFAQLPPDILRGRIDQRFGEGTAESIEGDLENIFGGIGHAFSSAARDVGQFAQKAAPVALQIGGGVIQGATAGSSLGLPGIIAGAAIGGTGAGLRTLGTGTARDVGNALGTVTNLAGQLTPMGRAGAAIGSTVGGVGQAMGRGGGAAAFGQAIPALISGIAGAAGAGGAGGGIASMLGGNAPQIAGALTSLFGGSSAAGQLASAVQRPEVQQALAATRLGDMGRRSIPVGSAQNSVPTAAILQMLNQLLSQASHEWAETAGEAEGGEAEVDFMRDSEGAFAGDPSNPGDRAARIWGLLNAAQWERWTEAVEAEAEAIDSEAGWESFGGEAEGYGAYDADAEYWDSLDRAEAEAIDAELETLEYEDA